MSLYDHLRPTPKRDQLVTVSAADPRLHDSDCHCRDCIARRANYRAPTFRIDR